MIAHARITTDVWFTTVSGRHVSLLDPQPETIAIGDLAHSLSMICRFNGHIRSFYSVAQHSVFVSNIVEPRLAMVGLLHDAAEAYLGDVASPVKKIMAESCCQTYKAAEARLWHAICARFDLDPGLLAEIKPADHVALATEIRDLSPHDAEYHGAEGIKPHSRRVWPCTATMARRAFLARYNDVATMAQG